MKEGSINIMLSWIENLDRLDKETRLEVWDCIMQQLLGREPAGTSPIIAALAQAYLDQIERMEEAKAAGKKGGRPVKNPLSETENPPFDNQKPPFSDLETPPSETENPPFDNQKPPFCYKIKENKDKENKDKDKSEDKKGEYEGESVTAQVGGQTPEPPTSSSADAKEKKAPLSVAAMAGEGAATPPKEQKPKASRFRPPSVEEVAAYCAERNNAVNAQSFVDFYSSKGWVVGKSPMKDWKAAVRTWEVRDRYNTSPPKTEPPKIGTEVPAGQIAARAYEIYLENQKEKEAAIKEGKVWI